MGGRREHRGRTTRGGTSIAPTEPAKCAPVPAPDAGLLLRIWAPLYGVDVGTLRRALVRPDGALPPIDAPSFVADLAYRPSRLAGALAAVRIRDRNLHHQIRCATRILWGAALLRGEGLQGFPRASAYNPQDLWGEDGVNRSWVVLASSSDVVWASLLCYLDALLLRWGDEKGTPHTGFERLTFLQGVPSPLRANPRLRAYIERQRVAAGCAPRGGA